MTVTPRLRAVLLVVVVLLVLAWIGLNVLAWRSSDGGADAGPQDLAWQEVLAWDFAEGDFPTGWGWGTRRFGADHLELEGDLGDPSVYFLPVNHTADFVLATEFMLVGAADGAARLHLMTRDRGGVNHLGGAVLTVDSSTMAVYHKVNGADHLQEIAPLDQPLSAGVWYRVRFTVARGSVTVHLNGAEVFTASGPFPGGLYCEPYLAAEAGRVRVRKMQILDIQPVGAVALPASG